MLPLPPPFLAITPFPRPSSLLQGYQNQRVRQYRSGHLPPVVVNKPSLPLRHQRRWWRRLERGDLQRERDSPCPHRVFVFFLATATATVDGSSLHCPVAQADIKDPF